MILLILSRLVFNICQTYFVVVASEAMQSMGEKDCEIEEDDLYWIIFHYHVEIVFYCK